ncbi:MAG: hypothetical protein ABSH05_00200 [Bryobacteraceae bacterium]|jgi:hypothetical protein
MKREDIEKLLGGYATGTLTEEERRVLFEAALSDQALFEALAGEEALKELLEDPGCRRQVEQALRERPQGLAARLAGWMRRPQAWALAGTLATTTVLAIVVIRVHSPKPQFELAKQQAPAAPTSALPAPAIAPSAPPRHEAARPARRFDAPAKSKEISPPAVAADRLAAPEPPPVSAVQSTPGSAASVMVASRPPAQAPAAPQSAQQQTATAGAYKGPAARQVFAETSTVDAEAQALRSEAKDQKKARLPVLGMLAKQERAAPLAVHYRILAKGADGRFAEQDPKAPLAPGAQVRVSLTTNQAGYLYVNNTRGVLFATQAAPGISYLVDPQPGDRLLNVVLSRQPITVPPPGRKLLLDGRAKGAAKPDGRVEVEIDLNRP